VGIALHLQQAFTFVDAFVCFHQHWLMLLADIGNFEAPDRGRSAYVIATDELA